MTVPQGCSLIMFGVFPIIPYPMQQKQRLIKHLRDSLTTCTLELSPQSLQTGQQGPGFPNTAGTVLGTQLVYSASLVLLPLYSGIQLCIIIPGWTHWWKMKSMRVLCTSTTPYGLSWEAIPLNSGPQCSQKLAHSERFLPTQETLGLLCVHWWKVHVSVCAHTAAVPWLSHTKGAPAGRNFGSLLCPNQNYSAAIRADGYLNWFWQNHQDRHVVVWQVLVQEFASSP